LRRSVFDFSHTPTGDRWFHWCFDAILTKVGFLAIDWQIIHATFMVVPKQRNTH